MAILHTFAVTRPLGRLGLGRVLSRWRYAVTWSPETIAPGKPFRLANAQRTPRLAGSGPPYAPSRKGAHADAVDLRACGLEGVPVVAATAYGRLVATSPLTLRCPT